MPKPRVQVLVCAHERPSGSGKPSCAPRGAPAVLERFKARIRELGLDGEVIVTKTGCLKHCSRGTTVVVWPHGFWYAGATVEDVGEIVETTVCRGEEVARLRMPDIPWE